MRDTWSVTGGASYQCSRRNSVSAYVDVTDSIERGECEMVNGYVSYRRELSLRSWVTLTTYAGLSDTAADYGLAVRWGTSFRPKPKD